MKTSVTSVYCFQNKWSFSKFTKRVKLIEMGWVSPGGVRYRAPYASYGATKSCTNRNCVEITVTELDVTHISHWMQLPIAPGAHPSHSLITTWHPPTPTWPAPLTRLPKFVGPVSTKTAQTTSLGAAGNCSRNRRSIKGDLGTSCACRQC